MYVTMLREIGIHLPVIGPDNGNGVVVIIVTRLNAAAIGQAIWFIIWRHSSVKRRDSAADVAARRRVNLLTGLFTN